MTRATVVLMFLLPLTLPHANVFQERSTAGTERESARKHPRQNEDDQSLLESGQATRLRPAPAVADEIKIVQYNIRWRSGNDLKELVKLFREDPEIGNATIMGLQEVDRHKKRSKHTNTAKLIGEELGLHYAWAAPPAAKAGDEEETGVALLSLYPLSDVRRIVLPHKGPGGRSRVAIGATIRIGGTDWRVYSAHGETRISFDKKLDQMGAVLQDLNQYSRQMPAIVLGDLNTWEPNAGKKVVKLFTDAGFATPFDGKSTFRRSVLFVPIEFRLDWVWLRTAEVSGYGIDRQIDISDHFPLWVKVKLNSEK